MIQRGSSDESEARRHIAAWHGLMRHWNIEADSFRRAARGRAPATPDLLEEAERMRSDIRRALEVCDVLGENLAPGHELRAELLQVAGGLDALGESLAISVEGLERQVENASEVVRLRFLVSALREGQTLIG
jgi:hypothetical protein